MSSYKDFVDKIKPEFEKAYYFLEKEVAKIRTGRASPSLVEDLVVNYMGINYSLKQLAAISSPASNQIIIQPWDISYLEPIEKAVIQSKLGFSLAIDKNIIRLTLPLMTEEYRKDLIKILRSKAEEARQIFRKWRDEAWGKIQQAQKNGQISEDDKYRGKDALQKLIDEYQEKVKKFIENKEKELI